MGPHTVHKHYIKANHGRTTFPIKVKQLTQQSTVGKLVAERPKVVSDSHGDLAELMTGSLCCEGNTELQQFCDYKRFINHSVS